MVKMAQVHMSRRIAMWWPRAGEEFPQLAKRAARWSEERIGRSTELEFSSSGHMAVGGALGKVDRHAW